MIVQGFSEILALPAVNNSLSLAGGMLLVFMGMKMLRGAVVGGEIERSGSLPGGSDIWCGMLGSLANPYWSIWWVSVGMAYAALAMPLGLPGIAVFFAGHISADYFWYSAVSFSVYRGEKRFADRLQRKALPACGVFLAGFGGWFVIRGAGCFLGLLPG